MARFPKSLVGMTVALHTGADCVDQGSVRRLRKWADDCAAGSALYGVQNVPAGLYYGFVSHCQHNIGIQHPDRKIRCCSPSITSFTDVHLGGTNPWGWTSFDTIPRWSGVFVCNVNRLRRLTGVKSAHGLVGTCLVVVSFALHCTAQISFAALHEWNRVCGAGSSAAGGLYRIRS